MQYGSIFKNTKIWVEVICFHFLKLDLSKNGLINYLLGGFGVGGEWFVPTFEIEKCPKAFVYFCLISVTIYLVDLFKKFFGLVYRFSRAHFRFLDMLKFTLLRQKFKNFLGKDISFHRYSFYGVVFYKVVSKLAQILQRNP